MTITELLTRERESGYMCLSLRGLFFTAYGGSAQALGRVCGYKVKRTAGLHNGAACCYAGFPAPALDKTLARLLEGGGRVVVRRERYVEIEGIPVPFDASLLAGYPVRGERPKDAARNAAIGRRLTPAGQSA